MALPGIEPGSTQVGNDGYKTPKKPQCGILPLNHSTRSLAIGQSFVVLNKTLHFNHITFTTDETKH